MTEGRRQTDDGAGLKDSDEKRLRTKEGPRQAGEKQKGWQRREKKRGGYLDEIGAGTAETGGDGDG